MVLKNIMRCAIHGLPWPLPPSVPQLAKYSMRRRNVMVIEATCEIPLEMASGAKVNFEFEFGVGFVDRAECYVRPNKTKQIVERTVTAVALYLVGRNGTWCFLKLDNGALITCGRN